MPAPPAEPPSPRLTRTRTTPNRAHYEKNRSRSRQASGGSSRPTSSKGTQDSNNPSEREVRKMKSAGELRRNHPQLPQPPSKSAAPSPQRVAMSEYVTSASSSNLLDVATSRDSQVLPKRFASLGVAAGPSSPNHSRPRLTMDNSFWDSTPGEEDGEEDVLGKPMPRRATLSRDHPQAPQIDQDNALAQLPSPPPKDEKDKSRRWGFLKKMSMGKMRTDSSPRVPSTGRSPGPPYRQTLSRAPSMTGTAPGVPQIDVRISTTGALLNAANHSLPPIPSDAPLPVLTEAPSPPPPQVPEKPYLDALKMPSSPSNLLAPTPTPRATKRRSFLPIDMSPIPIPTPSTFVRDVVASGSSEDLEEVHKPALDPVVLQKEALEQMQRREEERIHEARVRALRSVMAYLRDMHDLGLTYANVTPVDPLGGIRSRRPTVVESRLPSDTSLGSVVSVSSTPSRPGSTAQLRSSESWSGLRTGSTTQTNSVATTDSSGSGEERKHKDDRGKRSKIIREIVETERTYVKGLQELVDIYIDPAAATVSGLGNVGQKQETVVPAAERKVVFSGLEALFRFHKDSFLPALERASASLLVSSEELAAKDADGYLSLDVAMKVAQIFVSHAAFMKMYSTYINNFDNSVQRIKMWTLDRPPTSSGQTLSPSSSSAQLAGLGISMSSISVPGALQDSAAIQASTAVLTSSQRKRIKNYLKRCRLNPRHSQLNLEGYLLLPVQRIPRYRLLLEELVRSSPPMYDYVDDPLERALAEISSLANNMNEGKRESESRRRLVQWQARIRGKFPSPLVQPHRRLIMDGPLHLTRVVRKATVSFEVIDAQGDTSEVQVECLSPELTPRSLIGILCNDLLVLCRDPSEGQDPGCAVDLWAVLRMQTLPQPASIVHGNALRLVDNKAILYFDAPSTSDALTWFRGNVAAPIGCEDEF
ncbi:uncharacterized protein FIBRA_04009 [Fibroporia radiculosa]|uniref:DH domain-containing protein n=1 Tax=Fibroporia radiculosa TaxID=599839 RepID=J4I9X8_9APHY|nr:uncharacterized protein FIBRA_04009 [Fibroporia radiculosa]CCM01936.1 predicted protein [Fibroporia radiculosa]